MIIGIYWAREKASASKVSIDNHAVKGLSQGMGFE